MGAMIGLGGYARYAVYWTPPAGSWLEAFGASWLGYDAVSGERRMQPALDLPVPLPEIAARPARYGFHATLKAPFRLAEDTDAAALDRDLAALAARLPPATAPQLAPGVLSRFVALLPGGNGALPSGELSDLAATALALVEGLDRHRAPLTDAEIAKRREAGLTPEQEAALLRYGYPGSGPGFRFHVTLSGPLEPAAATAVAEAVDPLATPYLDDPFRLDEVCLFGDPGEGRPFRLLRRHPLTGTP